MKPLWRNDAGPVARLLTVGCALLGIACGDPARDLPAPADAGLFGLPEAGAQSSAACVEGMQRACVCAPSGSGLETCSGGQYGPCTGCPVVAPVFSRCVPGHYTGTFAMSYTPGPAGLCGVATLFGGSGSGPLEFDVVSSGSTEFFQIGGGCLRGSSDSVDAGLVQLGAEVFAKGVEFKAQVSGSVDCATGLLKGELRGAYRSTSVCGLGLVEDDFFFKGPIRATYDPATQSFKDGYLELLEPPVAVPLSGQPGGKGEWQVARDDAGPDAGTSDAATGGARDCLDGVMFKDFELPADAG
jgi:hypothetical protein